MRRKLLSRLYVGFKPMDAQCFILLLFIQKLIEIESVKRRISSDLHDDLGTSLTKISMFSQMIDVKPEKINDLKKVNVAKYPPMSVSTRKKLLEYFQESNEKLYNLINCRFEWDK